MIEKNMRQIKALCKYALSYFKQDWDFSDYPLETWRNQNTKQEGVEYIARFVNWLTFIESGSSREEAIENLRNKFLEYKKNNALPRPGSKVPIEFASSNRVEQYESIAVDFFDHIIELNFYDCFISDESSLYDFGLDDEETMQKIKQNYGIEPEDGLFLVDIFEKIANSRNA